MGATALPYVVSFVLDESGDVLDGTPICDAIERIDSGVRSAPLYYSISCVYPTVAQRALERAAERSLALAERIVELKANGSPLHTNELVQLDHPEATDPERLAGLLWSLHESHPALRVIGGCCGTDDRHIRALAARMSRSAAS